MATLKNGILTVGNGLSINEKKPFGRIYELGLYITIVFYYIFYSSRVLMVIAIALGICTSLLFVIGKIWKSRLRIPMNTIWYFLFFSFAELSAAWAFSPETALTKYFRMMIMDILICFALTEYIDTKDDLEKALSIYVAAVFTIVAIEMIFTPFSEWTGRYFGMKVGNNNPNTYGFIALFAGVISFYKGYILGKKRIFWYSLTVLFIFNCILTSSRKATSMSFICIMFLIATAFNKRMHWIHLIGSLLAAGAVLVLLFKVDVFYDVIGYRFDTLFSFLSDSNNVDYTNSLSLRSFFIEYAKGLFRQKPFLGHGFANFAKIVEADVSFATGVYSHNNYWEILADLGITGFLIYYSFYFYLMIKTLARFFKNKKDYIFSLSFALLCTLMILEWGVVSMISLYAQIIITFIYSMTYIQNSKRKYSYIQSPEGGRNHG